MGYGVKARWNYFEAGHGKGPCGGLWGRVGDKQMWRCEVKNLLNKMQRFLKHEKVIKHGQCNVLICIKFEMRRES